MQYHVLSLISHGFEVDMIGYQGTPLPYAITSSEKVKVVHIRPVPACVSKLPRLPAYVVKSLWQGCGKHIFSCFYSCQFLDPVPSTLPTSVLSPELYPGADTSRHPHPAHTLAILHCQGDTAGGGLAQLQPHHHGPGPAPLPPHGHPHQDAGENIWADGLECLLCYKSNEQRLVHQLGCEGHCPV